MNKDAESRWKVGMSNIKLKMRVQIAGKWKQMSEAQMSAVQKKYAGVDFAKLETWKVPPPPQRASAQRYYGD